MNRRTVLIGGTVVAAAGAGAASFAAMGSSAGYAEAIATQRAPLAPDADARELVRYASLAANGHNTQPWRFQLAAQRIRIAPDLTRRTPAVDPDDHHLYVSIGCAAENLRIAAAARGLAGEPVFDPSGDGAAVFEYQPAPQQAGDLFDAIPRRQSARTDYDGRAVSAEHLRLLEQAAQAPGVALTLLTERPALDAVRDLVIAGNDAQMADRAFMAELRQWMRFNPNAALRRGDGILSLSSGNPALPDWLGPVMFDLAFKPAAENDKYARQLASSAGVAVFVGDAADAAHWFAVGRACQRFALQATALGIKLAFINQPVEVAALRPDLAARIGMPGKRPDIVMRFGYGPDMPMSPRRPVDAVIEA